MDPLQIAIGTFLFVALAAIALGIVGRRRPSLFPPGAAAVIGAGVLFLYWTQEGLPQWPPLQQWQSVAWLALTLVGMTIADAFLRRSPEASVGHRFAIALLAAIAVATILRVPLAGTLAPAHVAALGTLAVASLLAPLGSRSHGFGLPASLAFTAITLALLLLLSHFAKATFVALGLGAALGATALAAWFLRATLGSTTTVVVVALLAALAAIGRGYADEARPAFPHVLWTLPVLAPLLAWTAECPRLARRAPLAALVRVLAPLALLAITLLLALGLASAAPSVADDPYAVYR